MVSARSSQLDFVSTDDAKRVFEVVVEPTPQGFVGSLEVIDVVGGRTKRSFEAPSCDEIASALSLLVALTADPRSEPDPPHVSRPATSVEATRDAPRPPRPSSKPAISLGANVGATSGVAPTVVFGPAAFVDVSIEERGTLCPEARLTVQVADTGLLGPESRSARFRWGRLGIDACPFRLGSANSLSFRPCAVGGIGAVAAEGLEIAKPTSGARLWWDVGVAARARWKVGRTFFGEAQAALLVPLAPQSFVFEKPHWVVHETP